AALATLLALACTGTVGDGDEGSGGASTGDAAAGPLAEPTPDIVAVCGLRRLTKNEYDNTLRDVLGDDTQPGQKILPGEPPNPFDNAYTTQTASQALIDGADVLAEDAVARLLADPARLAKIVDCKPTGPSDRDCFRHFVTVFGRRALRRALSEADI